MQASAHSHVAPPPPPPPPPCIPVAAQTQPIVSVLHRPSSRLALESRSAARASVFGLVSSGVAAPSSSSTTVGTLLWILQPAEPWATDPSRLDQLLRTLLRGREESWAIHVYTSRAKAAEHSATLARRPTAFGYAPSARPAEVVHAIVTTLSPALASVVASSSSGVSAPPIIYLGNDAVCLGEVAITPRCFACARLDQVMGIACRLRSAREKAASGLGLANGPSLGGLRELLATHAPTPLTAPREWDEYTETRVIPRTVRYDPVDVSRPTSPATRDRRVHQAWTRHAFERESEAEAKEQERVNTRPPDELLQALPPTAQRALHSGKRLGLADAAPMLNARESFHQHPPSSRLLTPSKAQLRVDISGSFDGIGIPVFVISPPPTTFSAEAAARHVQFSISTKHALAVGGDRTPAKRPIDGLTVPASSQSVLISPSRSVRNPFGTSDGLPSPAQRSAQSHTPLGPGPVSTRPVPLVVPVAPITLSVETKEDTERLAAIHALAVKLSAYELPEATKSRVLRMPSSTARERREELHAALERSHVIPEATKALLIAERASTSHTQTRRLNEEEALLVGKVFQHARDHAEWMANQQENMWELQETKSRRVVLDREAVVERFVGERAYRQTQLAAEREALEEMKRRKIAERIQAFNDSQSTARAVALARVPDAPKLTNLQAVFLSPRSRKQVGAPTPNRGPSPISSPSRTTSASSFSPLSPRTQLARSQHRPLESAIESALRLDYAALDVARREAERTSLQLEAVQWAKARQIKLQAARERIDIEEQQAADQKRWDEDRQGREKLRTMLQQAFAQGEEEEAEDQDQLPNVQPTATTIAEADERRLSRARRAQTMVDALTPASPPPKVSREVAAARALAAAVAAEQAEFEKAAASLRAEQAADRHAAWSASAQPAMPVALLSKRRRVERRNPHEWHEAHLAARGLELHPPPEPEQPPPPLQAPIEHRLWGRLTSASHPPAPRLVGIELNPGPTLRKLLRSSPAARLPFALLLLAFSSVVSVVVAAEAIPLLVSASPSGLSVRLENSTINADALIAVPLEDTAVSPHYELLLDQLYSFRGDALPSGTDLLLWDADHMPAARQFLSGNSSLEWNATAGEFTLASLFNPLEQLRFSVAPDSRPFNWNWKNMSRGGRAALLFLFIPPFLLLLGLLSFCCCRPGWWCIRHPKRWFMVHPWLAALDDINRAQWMQSAFVPVVLAGAVLSAQDIYDWPLYIKLLLLSPVLLAATHAAIMSHFCQTINFQMLMGKPGILFPSTNVGRPENRTISPELRESFLFTPIHFTWGFFVIAWESQWHLTKPDSATFSTTGRWNLVILGSVAVALWLYALPALITFTITRGHAGADDYFHRWLWSLTSCMFLLLFGLAWWHYTEALTLLPDSLKSADFCDDPLLPGRVTDFHDSFELYTRMWIYYNWHTRVAPSMVIPAGQVLDFANPRPDLSSSELHELISGQPTAELKAKVQERPLSAHDISFYARPTPKEPPMDPTDKLRETMWEVAQLIIDRTATDSNQSASQLQNYAAVVPPSPSSLTSAASSLLVAVPAGSAAATSRSPSISVSASRSVSPPPHHEFMSSHQVRRSALTP